ncbi:hypothetical protein NE237_025828 [Protea cynaroides]|uniref:Uncharacterized protein n=1 Tax=Protea cynaroides TaxID=273540 RepID=A0A9Q0H2L8_9MAGN|nr:hypothetical protein NE237_025828 [Protea cynaroides]
MTPRNQLKSGFSGNIKFLQSVLVISVFLQGSDVGVQGASGSSELSTKPSGNESTLGVLTRQILGSPRALFSSIWTPKVEELLKSWPRQIRLLSTSPTNSSQQPLSSFVKFLPASTYINQSKVLSRVIVQSLEGDAVVASPGDIADATAGACADVMGREQNEGLREKNGL